MKDLIAWTLAILVFVVFWGPVVWLWIHEHRNDNRHRQFMIEWYEEQARWREKIRNRKAREKELFWTRL